MKYASSETSATRLTQPAARRASDMGRPQGRDGIGGPNRSRHKPLRPVGAVLLAHLVLRH